MVTESNELILTVIELGLLLAGAGLLLRAIFKPDQRTRWLATSQMPAWTVSAPEFGIYVVLILASGFFFQSAAQILLGRMLAQAPDRAGLELVTYGCGLHGGGLVGWLLFRSMRASWRAGLEPDPRPISPELPWRKVLLYAGGGLLATLPVVFLANLGWVALLHQLGLPDELQDSIMIFASTRSPLVVAGMFAVACVLAPLNEELLFRAGLHRFCQQRLGRTAALLISGSLFGAAHLNWAGFVPLAILGAGLAVLYRATGSIRVAVVAHGLFNLLNIVSILAGGPLS